MGLISKIANYGVRAVRLLPEMLFGTSAEVFGKGVKEAAKGSSIWTKIKAGAKAIEDDVAKQAAEGGGGFFKRTWKSLKTFPKDVVKEAKRGVTHTKWVNRQIERKMGADIAKQVGKSTFWGGAKGVGKAVVKRIPLINAIFILAWDGPKVVKKFINEGFGAGMKETAGVSVELGCMAAGAAIGSAIPGIGTTIGALVGSIVGTFIGMAAREKISPSDETKEAQGTKAYEKQCKELGLTDEEIEYAKESKLSIDEIKEILEEEKQDKNKTVTQKANKTVNTTDPYGFNAVLNMLSTNPFAAYPTTNYANPYQFTSYNA